MIEVKSPRYRDRTVLLARYRLAGGQDADVKILYGAYKGIYHVTNEVICKSPIETMRTRSGYEISMRAVPIDEMKRIGDLNE